MNLVHTRYEKMMAVGIVMKWLSITNICGVVSWDTKGRVDETPIMRAHVEKMFPWP